MTPRLTRYRPAVIFAMLAAGASANPARAADIVLKDAAAMAGAVMWLNSGAPGLVLAVVRGEESVVRGYGEIADGTGKSPDGDTPMRIGSITKLFCGATLASMVADGKVNFTDLLQDRLGWDVKIPEREVSRSG